MSNGGTLVNRPFGNDGEELTEKEKLLADVISLGDRIPCGGQICLGLNLDRATMLVDKLFTEHNLPRKDELISELTLWREHAEQGLRFAQKCDQLMQEVIRRVGAPE